MPIYVSSSGETGTGRWVGTMSGNVPHGAITTSSYTNTSRGEGVVTGSIVIQTYAGGKCQRVFIRMSGSGGNEWVFLTGSLGCVDEE